MNKKSFFSISLKPAKILAILGLLIAITLSWLPQLNSATEASIDEGLQRSLASFASARLLNGAISAAQGTETAFHPAGVGLTLAPGQLLDPLNDLVEDFSNLMLVASVAFGAHKILLAIGSEWVLALCITCVGLLWIWLALAQSKIPAILSNALLILLLVKFSVPVVVITSDWIFDHYMAQSYVASQEGLAASSKDLPNITPEDKMLIDQQTAEQPEKGFFDKFTMPNIFPENPVQRFKEAASDSIDHIINLMVIFVLQVIVIPVVTLWVLYRSVLKLLEGGRTDSPSA